MSELIHLALFVLAEVFALSLGGAAFLKINAIGVAVAIGIPAARLAWVMLKDLLDIMEPIVIDLDAMYSSLGKAFNFSTDVVMKPKNDWMNDEQFDKLKNDDFYEEDYISFDELLEKPKRKNDEEDSCD